MTEAIKRKVKTILYQTLDPTVCVTARQPLPALTTLLYRVCDGDQRKFEEAIRLISLFIEEALAEKKKSHGQN